MFMEDFVSVSHTPPPSVFNTKECKQQRKKHREVVVRSF